MIKVKVVSISKCCRQGSMLARRIASDLRAWHDKVAEAHYHVTSVGSPIAKRYELTAEQVAGLATDPMVIITVDGKHYKYFRSNWSNWRNDLEEIRKR